MNGNIMHLDVSGNMIKEFPTFPENKENNTGTLNPLEKFWKCSNLKQLKCSNNAIMRLPREIQGATSLEKLQLDHNNLVEFDSVWSCPLVSRSSY